MASNFRWSILFEKLRRTMETVYKAARHKEPRPASTASAIREPVVTTQELIPAQESGCVVAKIVEKPEPIYCHSGDIGDVIYSLPTVKTIGRGVFYISPEHRSPMGPHTWATEAYVENLRGLLESQPYIREVRFSREFPKDVTHDLNRFRQWWTAHGWHGGPTAEAWMPILRLHLKAFNVQYNEKEPWITVKDPIVIPDRPIVINYTERYNNQYARMWELIERHQKQLVFIGTHDEYDRFKFYCEPVKGIPYHPTPTLLDAARVIAGSKCYVGNQSCCLAIAQGLGKKAIAEKVLGYCKHAVVNNGNTIYVERGEMVIPSDWLR